MMTTQSLATVIEERPRTHLAHLPTPLEKLSRLSEELSGPTIWLKRDDCTGLGLGGNKTRKLEYLLGEAIRAGKDTVITFGAIQSNHCRQTAAACARLGLACHLVLTDQVSSSDDRYQSGGNVLLDRLFGATLHVVSADDTDAVRAVVKDLQQKTNLYVIPAGGSNATGALGYARCAWEILEQCQQAAFTPNLIAHASSSAGTQAGLLWGLECMNAKVHLLGFNVYHDDPDTLVQNIVAITKDLDVQHKTNTKNRPKVNHAYLGEGYGQINDETIAAIRMAATLEGIVFDPVYSGKALAGLIDQINIGIYNKQDHVVLIHTGGAPALNVYQASFE
jgi:L-cysteate sulfo-lyase